MLRAAELAPQSPLAETIAGSEPMGRGLRWVKRWRNERKRKKNSREKRKLAAIARIGRRC